LGKRDRLESAAISSRQCAMRTSSDEIISCNSHLRRRKATKEVRTNVFGSVDFCQKKYRYGRF